MELNFSLQKLAELLGGKKDVAQIQLNFFIDAENQAAAIEVSTRLDGNEEFIHKQTFGLADNFEPAKELHDMIDRALSPIQKDKRFGC